MAIVPVEHDLAEWRDLSEDNIGTIAALLKERGYCTLDGLLDAFALEEAVNEALALREKGFQPPKEVLEGLLGDTGSAWCFELQASRSAELQQEEQSLRAIDRTLRSLGEALSPRTYEACSMRLDLARGPTAGVVHFSRLRPRGSLRDDKPNPRLVSPADADKYLNLFQWRKVRLLHYIGPAEAVLHLLPVSEESESDQDLHHNIQLQPNSVVVLRSDMYRCRIDALNGGQGVTVEVDFLAVRRTGPRWHQDSVSPPQSLASWYMSIFHSVAESQVGGSMSDAWLKAAKTTCFSTTCKPVSIVSMAFELPANLSSEKPAAFVHALSLGLSAILPLPESWWDADDNHVAKDSNVNSTKNHETQNGTAPPDLKHLGFMTNTNGRSGFHPSEGTAAGPMDFEHLMLSKSGEAAIRLANLEKDKFHDGNNGAFFGLPSPSSSVQDEGRRSRRAAQAAVAYQLGVTGPFMAIDVEDASGQVSLDTAYTYLRKNTCGPYALASSVCCLRSAAQVSLECRSRTLSSTGQCRVFDASCDGVVLSESAVSLLLTLHSSAMDSAQERDDRGIIVGSAVYSAGTQSAAPNKKSITTTLLKAFNAHGLSGSLLDAVEASASGSARPDALEYGALRRIATSSESSKSLGVTLVRSSKGALGHAGPAAGLVAIVKACCLMEAGTHVPCTHLQQLLDVGAPDGGDANGRVIVPVEVVEAKDEAQLVGVSSFGASGTHVHNVILGFMEVPSINALRGAQQAISNVQQPAALQAEGAQNA